MTVKARGKAYKIGLDQDIESTRGAYADHKSDATIGYDTTEETKYRRGASPGGGRGRCMGCPGVLSSCNSMSSTVEKLVDVYG